MIRAHSFPQQILPASLQNSVAHCGKMVKILQLIVALRL